MYVSDKEKIKLQKIFHNAEQNDKRWGTAKQTAQDTPKICSRFIKKKNAACLGTPVLLDY